MQDEAVVVESPVGLEKDKVVKGATKEAEKVGCATDNATEATSPPGSSARVFLRGEYRYPALGDGFPGGGEQVTLLTIGGVPVSGCWQQDGRYVAWCPLPVRDRVKEQQLRDMGKRN